MRFSMKETMGSLRAWFGITGIFSGFRNATAAFACLGAAALVPGMGMKIAFGLLGLICGLQTLVMVGFFLLAFLLPTMLRTFPLGVNLLVGSSLACTVLALPVSFYIVGFQPDGLVGTLLALLVYSYLFRSVRRLSYQG
ncbi:unnamed protein product [Phaeothamnion confervicola]